MTNGPNRTRNQLFQFLLNAGYASIYGGLSHLSYNAILYGIENQPKFQEAIGTIGEKGLEGLLIGLSWTGIFFGARRLYNPYNRFISRQFPIKRTRP